MTLDHEDFRAALDESERFKEQLYKVYFQRQYRTLRVVNGLGIMTNGSQTCGSAP
jgi:hypothetical protein